MSKGNRRSWPGRPTESLAPRNEYVVWPSELPWPPKGNQEAEAFAKSVEELNQQDIAKAESNPEYVPIHRILILPPEGGVPSPTESPNLEAFYQVLAEIIARISRDNSQPADRPDPKPSGSAGL